MIYTYLGENDTGGIPVVLKSPAQVSTAIKELNGAPLFNKRVLVEPLDLRNPKDSPFNPRDIPSNPTVRWGWYANKSAATEEIKLRYPLTSYPQGIFTPFKQGRVVIFSGLPADNNIVYLAPRWLYPKLHAYNVLALSTARFYQSPSRHGEQRAYIRCVFQTADDAQEVCQVYNDTSPFGEKLHVHIARPPLKHLGASWDFGHNRAHGQPRDYGTADGTNFETMQDDVYRKWLLGKKDRGLWVPDHTY